MAGPSHGLASETNPPTPQGPPRSLFARHSRRSYDRHSNHLASKGVDRFSDGETRHQERHLARNQDPLGSDSRRQHDRVGHDLERDAVDGVASRLSGPARLAVDAYW